MVTGSFGAFSAGAATGAGFSWPEVGIITLTPSVANYLGSGTVTGTTSANVGRFVPSSFGTSLNTPVFGSGCAAGSFTYVGQPFTYTVAPVITVTAQALGGTTTQNYSRRVPAHQQLADRPRLHADTGEPRPDVTGLPAATADPAIVESGSGQVTLTFSAGTELRSPAARPRAVQRQYRAVDQRDRPGRRRCDGNPVTFGGGHRDRCSRRARAMVRAAGAAQCPGLGAARSADVLDDAILFEHGARLHQQHERCLLGRTGHCIQQLPAEPACGRNLRARFRQSGNLGRRLRRAAASRYTSPAAGGDFNLILAAPGSGNNGAATVTATAPSWLQYPWNAASGNTSPVGIATFGVFPGPASRIHQREVY